MHERCECHECVEKRYEMYLSEFPAPEPTLAIDKLKYLNEQCRREWEPANDR